MRVRVEVRKHMHAYGHSHMYCTCEGVNRTYVSTAHCDGSYFPMLFKHLSAELVKVKITVSKCNLNDESQFH